MRIIHTIATIGEWAGGPSRTATSLCSTVASKDCSIDLLAGHDAVRDGELVRPSSMRVHLHLIKSRSIAGIRLFPGFGDEIENLARPAVRSGAPVLVHDHGIWGLTNIAAANAARRAAVPYVLHPRGMLEPWALQYKANKKRLAWALYQRRIVSESSALVATSDQERDSIKRLVPRVPVAVIPNGVPFPQTIPNRGIRSETARANLLFMSRVHPKKNLLGLVRAWQEICHSPGRERWVLQIAGPDELGHTREVMALVHSLGLESRVEFVGPVGEANKAGLLESADLSILPSFSENFGLVVAEALANGLPVIATLGTPWSSLVDGGCGWWVDPTPNALAEVLATALDITNGQRHAMGLRGRHYAQAAFSWDRVGASTMQLYEWVLGRASGVPSFVYV